MDVYIVSQGEKGGRDTIQFAAATYQEARDYIALHWPEAVDDGDGNFSPAGPVACDEASITALSLGNNEEAKPTTPMTEEQLIALFKQYGDTDDSHAFERVEPKRSQRADVHAILLLDELLPGKYPCPDMICSAEHDQIWFEPGLAELAKVITEEQVLELVRCGVWIESDCGLSMFV